MQKERWKVKKRNQAEVLDFVSVQISWTHGWVCRLWRGRESEEDELRKERRKKKGREEFEGGEFAAR